jgi:hypothetical protein
VDLLRVRAIEHVNGNIADPDVKAQIVARMRVVVVVWQGIDVGLPNPAPVFAFAPTTTSRDG